jgi:hypothetical protein
MQCIIYIITVSNVTYRQLLYIKLIDILTINNNSNSNNICIKSLKLLLEHLYNQYIKYVNIQNNKSNSNHISYNHHNVINNNNTCNIINNTATSSNNIYSFSPSKCFDISTISNNKIIINEDIEYLIILIYYIEKYIYVIDTKTTNEMEPMDNDGDNIDDNNNSNTDMRCFIDVLLDIIKCKSNSKDKLVDFPHMIASYRSINTGKMINRTIILALFVLLLTINVHLTMCSMYMLLYV